jgi:hypothetical protein
MAALPQCIQSAKQLYDLRSRYKDAAVLITAIYSESMVIAASLSQVQNLLQHDALQSKPQLLQTFDSALTGCRVVYGCLEEEVRDLVAKAQADDLKFKDRARYLWKEDTFKELLTQIRGQQSALSLLIQGLQMESIADIRKLVEENSASLNQVIKRSKTLRQSHPCVRVPESLFNKENQLEDAADAESIIKSTEFTFDDEVITSRAYRRAMALYISNTDTKTTRTYDPEEVHDQPLAYQPPSRKMEDETKPPLEVADAQSFGESVAKVLPEKPDTNSRDSLESVAVNVHQDAFESIEKDYLPYMPRITSTAPYLSQNRANIPNEIATQILESPARSPARSPTRSHSEGDVLMSLESAPSLPPRHPSGPQLHIGQSTNVRSASVDDITVTSNSPSAYSNTSSISSYTIYDPTDRVAVSRKPLRKPLPLKHQISRDILNTVHTSPSMTESPGLPSLLQNTQMHETWLSLIDAEQKFVERMSRFRKMFYNNVLHHWPLLGDHLGAIPVGEQLAEINKEVLLNHMEQQIAGTERTTCDSSVFEQWTNRVHKIYREYCQKMPHAAASLRTTQTMDSKFGPFVNTCGLSIAWFGKSWEDYLKLPLSQLDLYANKIESLISIAETPDEQAAFQEIIRLKRAAAAVQWLNTLSSNILEEAQGREDVQTMERRIYTNDSAIFSQFRQLDSARRVRHQGGMAIKLKSQGQWQAVHVMLLDNFLLWGKVKSQKKSKGDKILVSDPLIAVEDLEVVTPCEQHQFQKATMFDDVPRGSVIYTITVKSRSTDTKPHMLGAFGFQEQKEWLGHLGHPASSG